MPVWAKEKSIGSRMINARAETLREKPAFRNAYRKRRALVPADGMSPQMRQMMKAMDENFKDETKVELEINPRHPLIRKLAEARNADPEVAGLVSRQLLDNALIAAGLLDDARETVARMNRLMEKAMGV